MKNVCLLVISCLLSSSIFMFANETLPEQSPIVIYPPPEYLYPSLAYPYNFQDQTSACNDPLQEQCFSPHCGFFVGLGGSYNSIKFDQDLTATDFSEVVIETTLVASGASGGKASPFTRTQSTFAPEFQMGYFGKISCTNWMWGVKFAYKYIGLTFSESPIDSLQPGILINTTNAPLDTTFTGHVTIESAQTSVKHELALLGFIGHSFSHGHAYLGIGPIVLSTQSKIYKASGFTNMNGVYLETTGSPANFSNEKWMWGGIAQIGVVYYLSPCWFVDFSYDYAITARYKNHKSSSFFSTSSALSQIGTLFINTTRRLTAQSCTLSINHVF